MKKIFLKFLSFAALAAVTLGAQNSSADILSPPQPVASKKAVAHIIVRKTDYTQLCMSQNIEWPKSSVLCEGDAPIAVESYTTQIPSESKAKLSTGLICADVIFQQIVGFKIDAKINYVEDLKRQLYKNFSTDMQILNNNLDPEFIRYFSRDKDYVVRELFSTKDLTLNNAQMWLKNSNSLATYGCDGNIPITQDPLVQYTVEIKINEENIKP